MADVLRATCQPVGLAEQESIGIGSRCVRLVAALLAPEVAFAVAARSGGSSEPSLRRKLFTEAQASIIVPSTEKWSDESSRRTRPSPISVDRTSRATSVSSRRSQLFERLRRPRPPHRCRDRRTSETADCSRSAPSTAATALPATTVRAGSKGSQSPRKAW